MLDIEQILNALKIEFNSTSGRYFFACPIHGSDNYTSLSIYENTGKWRCFTRHCEEIYGDSFADFVNAVLKIKQIDTTLEELDSQSVSFTKSPKIVRPKTIFNTFPREYILPYVNGNIPFYLRRGYSQEILEKYDIFICTEYNSPFYGRIVLPVYDDDRVNVIGLLGRTLSPKCNICKSYHSIGQSCPKLSHEKINCSKWKNAKGFARSYSLFNYWFAKDIVKHCGDLIIVESPGNTIKLAQAGILNAIGIYGTEITSKQIEKINNLAPKRIFLGLDNDAAGLAALTRLQKKLQDYPCIPFIPEKNDFGEMDIREIQDFYNLIMRNGA